MVRGVAWTPPDGMLSTVRSEWATFYRTAMDKYKITPQQYRDLYVAQHGCCYICRTAKGVNPDDPNGKGGRRLGVDHNHVTGRIRGLLCSGGDRTCNRVIGWLNHAQLSRAVEYLEQEPAQTVLSAGREFDRDAYPEDWTRDAVMREVLGLT